MSKFEELCQVYSQARRAYLESCQVRQEFAERFTQKMSEYFGCPIESGSFSFDSDGLLHFAISLVLYDDPSHPEDSDSERVMISLTLDKVIDNYIIRLYPWGEEFNLFWDEVDKFVEVYDCIFEKIKATYQQGITRLIDDQIEYRDLGW